MTWVRLDDGFHQNPKARAAGRDGRSLYIAGLCYCARLLTDGYIPKEDLPLIIAEAGVSRRDITERLLSAGLWADKGDRFYVRDYLDYNPSRERVEADRAAARERKRRQRHGVTPGVTDGVSHGGSHAPSPVPRPPLSGSSSSSLEPVDNPRPDVDDVLKLFADRKLAASNGQVTNPGPWKRKVLANARVELAEQAGTWLDTYDVTPTQVADALVAGTVPASWNTCRKVAP